MQRPSWIDRLLTFLATILPLGSGLIVYLLPRHGMTVLWSSFILVGFGVGLRMFQRSKLESTPRKRLHQLAPVLIPLAVGLFPAALWTMSAFPQHGRLIATSVFGVILPLVAFSYLAVSLKATLTVLNRNPKLPEIER